MSPGVYLRFILPGVYPRFILRVRKGGLWAHGRERRERVRVNVDNAGWVRE